VFTIYECYDAIVHKGFPTKTDRAGRDIINWERREKVSGLDSTLPSAIFSIYTLDFINFADLTEKNLWLKTAKTIINEHGWPELRRAAFLLYKKWVLAYGRYEPDLRIEKAGFYTDPNADRFDWNNPSPEVAKSRSLPL